MTSSSQQAFLMLHGDSGRGVVIHIRKAITTLGRDDDADVVIDDPTISRRHAEIALSGDVYSLVDLGSKNGTFVNQRNIGTSSYCLNDGDEISFGPSQVALTFQNSDLGGVIPRWSRVTESAKRSKIVELRNHD